MQILLSSTKVLGSLICCLWMTYGSCFTLVPNFNHKSDGNSVWTAIRDDFKLDHREDSPQVKAEIRKLLADPAGLRAMLKAAVPYIYFVRQQTASRGLPAEIALIPFIESAFNPNDQSRKGATGLWQLMPRTARDLGVKIKAKYDGRRNVVQSTNAAIAYFHDLGNMFKGNWYLAIAAYNCGQGKVQSVQRHQGTNNFWKMSLPRETELYVPKLLAVAAIIKNPEKYGVQLPNVVNEPYFTTLTVKNRVDLDYVARAANISVHTLKTLNPDYNHDIVPSKGGYILVVPYENVEKVKANLVNNVVT